MRCLPPFIHHALRRGRRLLSCSNRPAQLSAALGAALLLSSALSVSAIVPNTKPVIIGATVSDLDINEGDTVNVNVVFWDPDAEDRHPVLVRWDWLPVGGYGGTWTEKRALLAPGVSEYQTTATFVDDRKGNSGNPVPIKLQVWVSDEQPGNDNYDGAGSVGKDIMVMVHNVAPSITERAVTVTKPVTKGGPVVVEGAFTEPGQDTVRVNANWGDAATPQQAKAAAPCTVNEQAKTFRCEHTYAVSGAKSYQLTLTARDDDGGEDTSTRTIQMP